MVASKAFDLLSFAKELSDKVRELRNDCSDDSLDLSICCGDCFVNGIMFGFIAGTHLANEFQNPTKASAVMNVEEMIQKVMKAKA